MLDSDDGTALREAQRWGEMPPRLLIIKFANWRAGPDADDRSVDAVAADLLLLLHLVDPEGRRGLVDAVGSLASRNTNPAPVRAVVDGWQVLMSDPARFGWSVDGRDALQVWAALA